MKDQVWAHFLNPFVLLGHITWCQKFFWWRSFLWSFHRICRFASFYCCLNSNVVQDSCRFKATDLPYLVFFFFFQDIFYQKKVLEVHYKNLNEFVILCLENYHMVYWIPWLSDTKSRLIRKGTDAKDWREK